MNKKVFEGQRMWVLNLNHRHFNELSDEDKVYEVAVVKAGRKYITVVEVKYLHAYISDTKYCKHHEEKYDNEKFYEVSPYSSHNLLFFTKEEALNHEEAQRLLGEIRSCVSYGNSNKFSYAQMKAAYNILFNKDFVEKLSEYASTQKSADSDLISELFK